MSIPSGPPPASGPPSESVPPGAGAPPPAPPAERPTESVTYDRVLRGRPGWWRGLLAIVCLMVALLVVNIGFTSMAIVIDGLLDPAVFEALLRGEVSFTPLVMLANNLSLAALIPIAMLLQWAFFGVRPRWLSSVEGRFRWRWMLRLAALVVPIWVLYVAASFLLAPLEAVSLTGTTIALLVIVVLTTPLQSAGEEYAFRGLVQRAASSWTRRPALAFVIGVLVSGALFASVHFAADPWLIAYYFVFGASASIAARGTGGLEAPVLVHATNNVLLFIPTVLMGQLDQALDRSVGAGSAVMVIPMALCLAVALLSVWWGRRSGVATRSRIPAR